MIIFLLDLIIMQGIIVVLKIMLKMDSVMNCNILFNTNSTMNLF